MKKELRDSYFAGLIDGEGCIGLHSHGAKKHRRITIGVAMTCEKTVRALHAHFGVGGVALIKSANPKWKDQWRWRTSARVAREVLEVIRPYLITKAELVESLPQKKGCVLQPKMSPE